MKILVTGFDPFGGETLNPAYEAVRLLPAEINGATIISAEIPTVFQTSAQVLTALIEEHQPDVVLNIGQAGGRFEMTPEKIAINLDDARIPDNAGNQPLEQRIQAQGETAYFTQLPVKAMAARIQAAGIPSTVSFSAGTFVCNHVMYQMQYLIATDYPEMKAGFIHVPYLPSQVVGRSGLPSLALADITRGLEAAIAAIVDYQDRPDSPLIGGTTH